MFDRKMKVGVFEENPIVATLVSGQSVPVAAAVHDVLRADGSWCCCGRDFDASRILLQGEVWRGVSREDEKDLRACHGGEEEQLSVN